MADPVILYLLTRNDMATMSQGRSDAQNSHATSDFHEGLILHRFFNKELSGNPLRWTVEFAEWKENRNFGTAVVLMGPYADIQGAVELAKQAGFYAGITHDPSYAVPDGQTVHFVPVDTCGFIFGRKSALKPLLGRYPLLKAPEAK